MFFAHFAQLGFGAEQPQAFRKGSGVAVALEKRFCGRG